MGRNFEKLCGAGEFVLVFVADDLLLAFYLRETRLTLASTEGSTLDTAPGSTRTSWDQAKALTSILLEGELILQTRLGRSLLVNSMTVIM